MVAAAKSSELFIAVVTFFTLAVRHPVLLQVTVLKAGEHSPKLNPKNDRLTECLPDRSDLSYLAPTLHYFLEPL